MNGTQVTFAGNLTDDPELSYTPSGVAVANFRVAVTPRIKDGESWKDGETAFYRCAAWRDYAENATESLSKGDRVVVVGTLKTREWETAEGQKRLSLEVNVDELGPTLQWAVAKPQKTRRGERASQPAQTSASKSGDFNDAPPF